jgi:hypothetical protein
LHISSLHTIEVFPLLAFGALFDHAVAVRELSTEDVAEDLCIAVGMSSESVFSCNAVFIENAEASEVIEFVVVIASEAEGVEGLQPAAVFGISALAGATENDLGVGEWTGHGLI